MEFIAFPEKNNAIFKNAKVLGNSVITDASGSLGLYYDGKCHITYPNETLTDNPKMDWCSNLAKSKSEEDKPWISYSLNNKKIELEGFSVRSGCCWYSCCCIDDSNFVNDGYSCCCDLYSFSLQGSNDNKTWTTIHKVERADDYDYCQTRNYEFKKTQPFTFIRFVMDQERPGCIPCMQLNQMELYGNVVDGGYSYNSDSDDNEESVSIIGRVEKSES